jgi:hypothetical protein
LLIFSFHFRRRFAILFHFSFCRHFQPLFAAFIIDTEPPFSARYFLLAFRAFAFADITPPLAEPAFRFAIDAASPTLAAFLSLHCHFISPSDYAPA